LAIHVEPPEKFDFDAHVRRLSRALPKIELHIHLDGSLSFPFLKTRAKETGLAFPSSIHDEATLRSWIMEVRDGIRSVHEDNHITRSPSGDSTQAYRGLDIFQWTNTFLQTAAGIEAATSDLCFRLVDENVKYAEIRFCPALHTDQGLSARDATLAAVRGFSKTYDRLPGGIIVCALRTLSQEHSKEMYNLASEIKGVVGFDLAGFEEGFPSQKHEAAILLALKDESLGVTVHAGEWKESLGNLEHAVNLGVDRIGHGLMLKEDKRLLDMVAKKKIHIECCPVSNVIRMKGFKQRCDRDLKSFGTGKPPKLLREHPIKDFIRAGVVCSLNSDNTLLGGTQAYGPCTPSQQVFRVLNETGVTLDDLRENLEKTIRSRALFDRRLDTETFSIEVLYEFDRVVKVYQQALLST